MFKNKFTYFFLFVFLTSSLNYIKTATTHFERITYKSYTPSHQGASDYHSITICWGAAANDPGAETPGGNSWKYSIHRTVDDTNPVVEAKINNNNVLFDRYENYLLKINGNHATKDFVAWDITPTCNSTTDITCVDLKIKYFSCTPSAATFYGTVTSTNKVHITSTQMKSSKIK